MLLSLVYWANPCAITYLFEKTRKWIRRSRNSLYTKGVGPTYEKNRSRWLIKDKTSEKHRDVTTRRDKRPRARARHRSSAHLCRARHFCDMCYLYCTPFNFAAIFISSMICRCIHNDYGFVKLFCHLIWIHISLIMLFGLKFHMYPLDIQQLCGKQYS